MVRQQPEKTLFWRNEMSLNGVDVSLPLLLCLILFGWFWSYNQTTGRLDPTIEERENDNIRLIKITNTDIPN